MPHPLFQVHETHTHRDEPGDYIRCEALVLHEHYIYRQCFMPVLRMRAGHAVCYAHSHSNDVRFPGDPE